jgi:EAL domain-containing protein (putative c-di-GMP-specific phosphodiesterase class I)
MAVNLSPLQFRQPGLVGTIHDILKETRLPSQYLELEITEGALMDASSEAELQLNELKSLGIRLAIDDFGTGYSSLAYLKRFPIDKLKVDQSFVRDIPSDPADMEIAAAVVALGKNLHLEVLAEGIENEDQLSFLRHLGCHIGQGYLFSKPISSEECDILLARPTLPI